MKNNNLQKFRVKGVNEFAFVTNIFSVRKTSRHRIEKVAGNEYQASLNGTTFAGEIVQKKQNSYSVMVNGNIYQFEIVRDESAQRRKRFGIKINNEHMGLLKAPMPGKVCKLFVSKGTEVKQGEPLLILEAMKMQNQILSPAKAKVVDISVRRNENVLGDQVLLRLEALKNSDEQ